MVKRDFFIWKLSLPSPTSKKLACCSLRPQNSNWTLETISQLVIHQVSNVHGSSQQAKAALEITLVDIIRESNL